MYQAYVSLGRSHRVEEPVVAASVSGFGLQLPHRLLEVAGRRLGVDRRRRESRKSA